MRYWEHPEYLDCKSQISQYEQAYRRVLDNIATAPDPEVKRREKIKLHNLDQDIRVLQRKLQAIIANLKISDFKYHPEDVRADSIARSQRKDRW